NRIHWHYVRDDALFSTIKVVSRHQATQQYGVILPIELTTNEIRSNSEETVKSRAGKDSDEDDDKDDDDDDEEQETAKDDKETKETGTGGDEVRERGG
nr:hypothetical protein [Tanacetum cinerariifolium]